ncbi:MAG TPA: hypothetical protein VK167_07810 [Flavipsychrobacter sp.]|nr:hypothetical protein [Chitinophagales bacterium]HLO70757.1 hypothetical protein [Flavipsychrobacter sp.]
MRIFAGILILLHGIMAAICGIVLMRDVSGSEIGLQLSLLEHSPFVNYFYPGLILYTILGLGSFFTGICTLLKVRYYPWILVIIGNGIIIWIITQMIMIRLQFNLQYVIAAIGITSLVLGVLLNKKEKY